MSERRWKRLVFVVELADVQAVVELAEKSVEQLCNNASIRRTRPLTK